MCVCTYVCAHTHLYLHTQEFYLHPPLSFEWLWDTRRSVLRRFCCKRQAPRRRTCREFNRFAVQGRLWNTDCSSTLWVCVIFLVSFCQVIKEIKTHSSEQHSLWQTPVSFLTIFALFCVISHSFSWWRGAARAALAWAGSSPAPCIWRGGSSSCRATRLPVGWLVQKERLDSRVNKLLLRIRLFIMRTFPNVV